MNVNEFEKLKKKIDELKKEKTVLETKKEQIESGWKKDFKISSFSEAQALQKELSEKKETLIAKRDKLFAQIEELLPEGV